MISPSRSEALARLQVMLGYEFNDPAWLQLALTHRSVSGARNNERLEFLGDAILNFVVADYLYLQFPLEKEGRLSRLRSSLVKQETLAAIARDLGLGEHLLLGPGELKSGGFRRESILADAVEAVLGAIYRDSMDMAVCMARVHAWLGDRLHQLSEASVLKDAKSRLQEYLQGRRLELPVYVVTAVEGDAHDQQFHVSCMAPGLVSATTGSGPSRRIAEQNAAAAALKLLDINDE